MPVYGIRFRGSGNRIEEDFRDLAHAKSEAMRRAADLAELEPAEHGWAARIYKGAVLVHEVAASDLADPRKVQPHRPPPEQQEGLDEAVAESFPASDPPAAVNPVGGTRAD